MTDIRNTIVNALDASGVSLEALSQYTGYIDTAEKALLAREQNLTTAAIEKAREEYGYGVEAKHLLAGIGFEIKPEPQPEVEPEAEVDGDAPVSRNDFNKLVEAVRILTDLVKKDREADVF